MKTTKSVAYALVCLEKLSQHLGEYLQVSEIAFSQAIPAAYCQKILLALARAGIVESRKGRGFMLLKPFERITALEVIQALDSGEQESDLAADRSRKIHELLSACIQKLIAGLTVEEVMSSVR